MKVFVVFLLVLCGLALADHPAPASSYGPPPEPHYGPPPKAHYGPPPKAHYGPPPKAHYGPPPKAHYGPPPKAHYGPPPKAHYGPPPKAHYGPPIHYGKGKGKGKGFNLGSIWKYKVDAIKSLKEKILSGIGAVKGSLLAWKGGLLHAKGNLLANKGQALIDLGHGYKKGGKGKGGYYVHVPVYAPPPVSYGPPPPPPPTSYGPPPKGHVVTEYGAPKPDDIVPAPHGHGYGGGGAAPVPAPSHSYGPPPATGSHHHHSYGRGRYVRPTPRWRRPIPVPQVVPGTHERPHHPPAIVHSAPQPSPGGNGVFVPPPTPHGRFSPPAVPPAPPPVVHSSYTSIGPHGRHQLSWHYHDEPSPCVAHHGASGVKPTLQPPTTLPTITTTTPPTTPEHAFFPPPATRGYTPVTTTPFWIISSYTDVPTSVYTGLPTTTTHRPGTIVINPPSVPSPCPLPDSTIRNVFGTASPCVDLYPTTLSPIYTLRPDVSDESSSTEDTLFNFINSGVRGGGRGQGNTISGGDTDGLPGESRNPRVDDSPVDNLSFNFPPTYRSSEEGTSNYVDSYTTVPNYRDTTDPNSFGDSGWLISNFTADVFPTTTPTPPTTSGRLDLDFGPTTTTPPGDSVETLTRPPGLNVFQSGGSDTLDHHGPNLLWQLQGLKRHIARQAPPPPPPPPPPAPLYTANHTPSVSLDRPLLRFHSTTQDAFSGGAKDLINSRRAFETIVTHQNSSTDLPQPPETLKHLTATVPKAHTPGLDTFLAPAGENQPRELLGTLPTSPAVEQPSSLSSLSSTSYYSLYFKPSKLPPTSLPSGEAKTSPLRLDLKANLNSGVAGSSSSSSIGTTSSETSQS